MKTAIDEIDDIWKILSESSFILETELTGDIYKISRPANSILEDVVINCLPIAGDQIQSGEINVNIHVNNLELTIGGKKDNTQPDTARMKSLAAAAVEILSDVSGEDYDVFIRYQHIFSEPDINQHYINLRLNYLSINI